MKKQEELEKKARELERRERELESHSLGPGACKSGEMKMKVRGCRDVDFQALLFDFNCHNDCTQNDKNQYTAQGEYK